MLTNYQLLYITTNHTCTQDALDGIYSFDHIPLQVRKFPAFWICNNKDSNHEGEHWFACVFPGKHHPAEMFCSFGRSPQFYSQQLEDILKSNSNGTYVYNKTQVQKDNSTACAYFTLYYVDRRCRGISIDNCIENLSPLELEQNEEIVVDYVRNHMMSDRNN